jgi:hypothetical protein
MAQVSAEWLRERRAALPGELLELITLLPGRTKTFYLYMRVESGGLRGLSDDKYAALDELIATGRVEWGRNRGRNYQFKGLYPAGHPLKDTPPDTPLSLEDSELERALLAAVEREPGRAGSHYCRLPLSQGGPLGSQARKEAALGRLVRAGRVKLVPLPKPQGRKTQGLWPAAGSGV